MLPTETHEERRRAVILLVVLVCSRVCHRCITFVFYAQKSHSPRSTSAGPAAIHYTERAGHYRGLPDQLAFSQLLFDVDDIRRRAVGPAGHSFARTMYGYKTRCSTSSL